MIYAQNFFSWDHQPMMIVVPSIDASYLCACVVGPVDPRPLRDNEKRTRSNSGNEPQSRKCNGSTTSRKTRAQQEESPEAVRATFATL